VITLDTSGILALLNRRDPDHRAALGVFETDGGPFLVPAGILAEAAYMVERRLGTSVLNLFLEDLESGAYVIDCGDRDLPRIRGLVLRYADLPLGFSDASVVACAERNGGRILTLDGDFGVVARETAIVVVP